MDFIDDLQKWLDKDRSNRRKNEKFGLRENEYEDDYYFNDDDDDIEENTTGNVAGYNTPFAFSNNGYRFKDKQYERFIDKMRDLSEKSQRTFAQEWKEYANKPKLQFQYGINQMKKELGDLERMVKLMDSFSADDSIQLHALWKASRNDLVSIENRLSAISKTLNNIYGKL